MRYKYNKRVRVKRLRALAKAMREIWAIKRKCKPKECPLEQGKPLDSPSKLFNLVSVPVFEDESVIQVPAVSLESTQHNVSTNLRVADAEPAPQSRDDVQSSDTSQSDHSRDSKPPRLKPPRWTCEQVEIFGSLDSRTLRVRPEPAQATSLKSLFAVRRYYKRRTYKKKCLAAELIDSSLVDGKLLLKKKRGRPLMVKNPKAGTDKTKNKPKQVKQYDNEYECLKVLNGDACDLTPLSNILQRTANAIGVSEQTISQVLQEERHVASPEEEKEQELDGGSKRSSCTDPEIEVVEDAGVKSVVYPIKEEVVEGPVTPSNQYSKHFESSSMTVEEYETSYDDLLLPVKVEPAPEYRHTTKNMLLLEASPHTVRHSDPVEPETGETPGTSEMLLADGKYPEQSEAETTGESGKLRADRQSIAAHITNHRHHVPDATDISVKSEPDDACEELQYPLDETSTSSPITIIV